MAYRRLFPGLFSLLLILAVAAAGMGCGGRLAGSNTLVTREMDYSGFTRLAISSAFTVDISRGDSYRVSITADDNLIPYLNVYQPGNTLHIGLKPGATYLRTTQRAVIVMPDLEGLDISGGSSGKVSGFRVSRPLEIESSGASSLTLDNIAAGNTRVEVSGASGVAGIIDTADAAFEVTGASNVVLSGSAQHLDIEVSGSSQLDLSRLPAGDVAVLLSGAAKVVINTDGRLDGELSGTSWLEFAGSPVLGDIIIGGGARLSRA